MQKTRTIQDTQVPALGFGTYKLNGSECVQSVGMALETGYRHIDTAQLYENEEEVGKALRQTAVSRSEIFLTTKVWPSEFTAARFLKSVENSLRKLRQDYVDLLLIHWPADESANSIALEQASKALDKQYARHIGVSNFTLSQLQKALSEAPVFCNQVEYHPYLSQDKMIAACRENDLLFTAYQPLARGLVLEDDTLKELGRKYGKTPPQIVLRWMMQQENVAAIPKASSLKHMQGNRDIFDFELAEEDMQRIFGLNEHKRLTSPEFAPDWD